MRDHDEQALAYVYFENEPGRRSSAKLLTKDETRRIAANIAKLPELCGSLEQNGSQKRRPPVGDGGLLSWGLRKAFRSKRNNNEAMWTER